MAFPQEMALCQRTVLQLRPRSHTGRPGECCAASVWAQESPQRLVTERERPGLTQSLVTDAPGVGLPPCWPPAAFLGNRVSGWRMLTFHNVPAAGICASAETVQ